MVDFESCSNFANFDWGKRGKKNLKNGIRSNDGIGLVKIGQRRGERIVEMEQWQGHIWRKEIFQPPTYENFDLLCIESQNVRILSFGQFVISNEDRREIILDVELIRNK